jgi:hypothetical protein
VQFIITLKQIKLHLVHLSSENFSKLCCFTLQNVIHVLGTTADRRHCNGRQVKRQRKEENVALVSIHMDTNGKPGASDHGVGKNAEE